MQNLQIFQTPQMNCSHERRILFIFHLKKWHRIKKPTGENSILQVLLLHLELGSFKDSILMNDLV